MANNKPVAPVAPAKPGAAPTKAAPPAPRRNPAVAQMSRRDSLNSLNEFGSVLTSEQQAKARAAMQNKGKPGPLHQLLNVFNFAGKNQ